MQGSGQGLKQELEGRLKVIFNKYAGQSEAIPTSKVEEIVRVVLGQTKPQEIDYIIKNMFRLDADGNGSVDFLEFGNFLFKRHCGQMSLQKMHKAGLISKGSERKINMQEFRSLINNAYKFLGVQVNEELATQVFKEADKDGDGYITYVQYFQFIQRYACQKIVPPKPIDLGKKWNSRLRLYLWAKLRKLYEAYVLGKTLTINDQNLRGLVLSILGELNEAEITFILSGLFKLDKGSIQFLPFAIIFLYLVAQLGLSRFQANHLSTKKFLNSDEFIQLLRNTYKFLNIRLIRKQILLLIFKKIDKNNDGLISLNEYQDWVKRYLAVDLNRGDEFYLKEDDQENFESSSILNFLPETKKPKIKVVFVFSSYDLADRVRKRFWELLVPFDVNKDQKFDENQIHEALVKLLKESKTELQLVTRNVFRYDIDGDNNVTYDEFTNFCVEQHFGLMAIQRLHKKKSYYRGQDRVMNEPEFGMTLNHALSFINMVATPEEISELFKILDPEKHGWITYQTYFQFLTYYFGSYRPDWWKSLLGLSALDRFIRIIFDQLRKIFFSYDQNNNLLLEQYQIEAILYNIFGLNEREINYVISQIFGLASRRNKSLTYEQLSRILLEIYFCQILLKRRYADLQRNQWETRKFNLKQFIDLVTSACFFLRIKPEVGDLTQIFKILDTDNDGFITFWEYILFIKKYLGIGSKQFDEIPDIPDKKPDNNAERPKQVSEEQWKFINLIWGELKAYFDKYDSGSKGYLTEADLKKFVVEVLRENTSSELFYIFQNNFRIDPNLDKKTQFNEFAPFILRHAGEIALQKFQNQQVLQKRKLSFEEFSIVLSNAFAFLSKMSKSQPTVKAIYGRIGKGGEPSYGDYFSWVYQALVTKFRK